MTPFSWPNENSPGVSIHYGALAQAGGGHDGDGGTSDPLAADAATPEAADGGWRQWSSLSRSPVHMCANASQSFFKPGDPFFLANALRWF